MSYVIQPSEPHHTPMSYATPLHYRSTCLTLDFERFFILVLSQYLYLKSKQTAVNPPEDKSFNSLTQNHDIFFLENLVPMKFIDYFKKFSVNVVILCAGQWEKPS
jgi:hypothetical protein